MASRIATAAAPDTIPMSFPLLIPPPSELLPVESGTVAASSSTVQVVVVVVIVLVVVTRMIILAALTSRRLCACKLIRADAEARFLRRLVTLGVRHGQITERSWIGTLGSRRTLSGVVGNRTRSCSA